MIFHSAEEFFTDSNPCKTHIYVFSKKHTAIKTRKDGWTYQDSDAKIPHARETRDMIKQTKDIKTDECHSNGNSSTYAEKPIRVDIRFHYADKDNTTEYQFGYVKQKFP